MKIDWITYKINGNDVEAKVTIPEKNDRKLLKDIYFEWKKVNSSIKRISTRGINIPEPLTENAFCLFFPEHVRIVKLKKGKCSFDCINTTNGEKVQIKAASIYPDLSSFGPNSEYDRLYFLDFSRGDGTFKVYDIPVDVVKKTKVNKKETFEEQQRAKRRPRFSIVKSIIIPNNIQPVKLCKL